MVHVARSRDAGTSHTASANCASVFPRVSCLQQRLQAEDVQKFRHSIFFARLWLMCPVGSTVEMPPSHQTLLTVSPRDLPNGSRDYPEDSPALPWLSQLTSLSTKLLKWGAMRCSRLAHPRIPTLDPYGAVGASHGTLTPRFLASTPHSSGCEEVASRSRAHGPGLGRTNRRRHVKNPPWTDGTTGAYATAVSRLFLSCCHPRL